MGRVKPKPIPWEEVPPELEFAKVLLVVAQAVEGMCSTDAARGRTMWALIVYFFTMDDSLVPLSGNAKAAFNGLRVNMDISRRSIINGKKGGRPDLLARKGTDIVRN